MNSLKLNRQLKIGRRTFTSDRIPVASVLGRNLIFGNDSQAIITAVRTVAKDGKLTEKITLQTKIKKAK